MSQLWSPQLKKWIKDAHFHGLDIDMLKHRPSFKDYAGGVSALTTGLTAGARITDSGDPRITDGTIGRVID